MIAWWLACTTPTTSPLDPPEPPPPSAAVSLDAARFLEGCWTTRPPEDAAVPRLTTGTTECWKQRAAHLNGALNDPRPDASPSLLLMRIAEADGTGLGLHVHLADEAADGASPSSFLPLVEAGPGQLTFRSPGDGFPSEAQYGLVDDVLTTRLQGSVEGSPVDRTYTMRRDARANLGPSIEKATAATPR